MVGGDGVGLVFVIVEMGWVMMNRGSSCWEEDLLLGVSEYQFCLNVVNNLRGRVVLKILTRREMRCLSDQILTADQ